MTSILVRMSAVWFVVCVAACGSSTRPPDHTSDNQSCEAMQADGVATLSKFVEEHRACTQDSDCITVALGARCFDSCSRTLAASSKDEYESVIATVNAGSCTAYEQHGCPAPVIPPCTPPSTPSCHAGVCE